MAAVTPSSYNTTEMGSLTYAIPSGTSGFSISNGVVSADQSGSVTVTVSASGGTKYNSGNVGTYNVEFDKQNITITAPSFTATLGGTVDVALASSTGYASNTMGTVRYSINNANNTTNATISGSTLSLSGATISSGTSTTIKIRAVITTNNKYNEKTVDYNVTINRANNPYGYLGSSLSGSNLTIADSAQYTLPTASNLKLSTSSNGSSEVAYNATEMGTLSFEVTDDGGITGINTGSFTGNKLVANPTSTGAGNSGTIKIKLKLEGGTKYNAKEFTYDVTYQ